MEGENGVRKWVLKQSKAGRRVNRKIFPVISFLIFLQLAESDFASTFRLLTVFAYGTYADYLGNQRGWSSSAVEMGEGQFLEGLRRNSWDTLLRSLRYTGSGSRPELV